MSESPQDALDTTIRRGDLATVEGLLERGADVHYHAPGFEVGDPGGNALAKVSRGNRSRGSPVLSLLRAAMERTR